MLIEKTQKGIRYIRENWKEWFVVIYAKRFISEGEMMPRFYLPVRNDPMRHAYECWIFPLAFFALGYYIIAEAFIGIWKDLRHFSRMLKEKNDLLDNK